MNVLILDSRLELINKIESLLLNGQLNTFLNITVTTINTYLENSNELYDIAFLNSDLMDNKLLDKFKLNNTIIVDLDNNIDNAFYKLNINNLKEDFIIFEKIYVQYLNENHYINIKLEDKNKKIKLNDIIYLEITGHMLMIKTVNDTYYTKKSINTIKKELITNKLVQVHRSFIVNLDYIYDVNKNNIVLVTKENIKIGRNYKSEFIKRMSAYIESGIV